MAKPKARVYKSGGCWYAHRPTLGFSSAPRAFAAPSWRGVMQWLEQEYAGASAGPQIERAETPSGTIDRSGWGADNWPAVIR